MRRIALAALLVTSAAAAKTDIDAEGAPDVGPYDPVSVRARLDGITAKLVVDYRIITEHPAADRTTSFQLALPHGAVVTAATITHDGIARRMTLDSRESIEKQMAVAFGGDTPERTPTMWVAKIDVANPHDSLSVVDVFIAAPVRARMAITLEIATPTCFFRDRRYVQAPVEWARALRAKDPSASVVEACSHRDTHGTGAWISFAAPEAARRPSGDRLQSTAARLAVTNDLHLARTELAIAENLADIPRDLATVILVDESRSMTVHQQRTQREIVLGYLRAAPNSRVQVLAFSRKTRPLLPAWTNASRAITRLQRELASLSPRNGSNFDVGLAEAGKLLAPITGTRRVLLVTDEAMASHLAERPEALAELVPAGTIINVAVASDFGETDDEGNAILARDDNAVLAKLAAVTTGMSTRLGELDSSRRLAIDAAMLVRPTSIDHVRATGLGWTDIDTTQRELLGGETCAGAIRAGDSCVWWTRGTKFAGPIQIEGLMWNQRIVRVVRPLADPGHTIAREITSSGVLVTADDNPMTSSSSDDERIGQHIDRLAHAVTASTSLFVRWGGDVPFSSGTLYGGFSGFGRSSTINIGHATGVKPPRVEILDLGPQLRPLVAHCKLDGLRAVVTMEITFQEIVNVDVAISPAPGVTGEAQKSCIEEATWDFTPALPTLERLRVARVTL